MWDRYDPRNDERNRDNSSERSLGCRGGSSERNRNDERDPPDVFTRHLDLPRGGERRPIRDRNRVDEIDGADSRALATIGAFRVVAESIFTTSATTPIARDEASSISRAKG